jgi:dihydrofolate synthase/folylpolyglutamate synthase
VILDEWLDHIGRVHPRDIDMGLDRVATVARRLGVERPAPVNVIVAGTNGKGSTCVALEQLLLDAGLRVGTTLSPHVSRFNERVRVDGHEVDDEGLCDIFATIDRAREEIPLTYFEFSALAALTAFRRAEVDTAILEVGLGGRLDAFNLVDAELAIVTSIGLDHQDYLGDDLETIGCEKAGVFRHGQTVLLGQVTASVREAARALDCRVHELDVHLTVREDCATWSCLDAALSLDSGDVPRGALAPVNCALALTAARLLYPGATLTPEVMARVQMPGRMETGRFEGIPVILDVAHNPAAAAFLAAQLKQRHPGRHFVAVYGALADKDAAGVVAALDGLVTDWVTLSTSGWRGQSAETLAGRVGVPVAAVAESAAAAMATAASLTTAGSGILVLGSFSAVEQARALIDGQPVDRL